VVALRQTLLLPPDDLLAVTHRLIKPRRPQTNGMIKRFNAAKKGSRGRIRMALT
jgi:transposase InsO family protein